MKDIKTYEIKGSLFDNKIFRYKNISAVVDFFDGDLLASRIFINAINTDNLDKIITVAYGFLIDFYQSLQVNPLFIHLKLMFGKKEILKFFY